MNTPEASEAKIYKSKYPAEWEPVEKPNPEIFAELMSELNILIYLPSAEEIAGFEEAGLSVILPQNQDPDSSVPTVALISPNKGLKLELPIIGFEFDPKRTAFINGRRQEDYLTQVLARQQLDEESRIFPYRYGDKGVLMIKYPQYSPQNDRYNPRAISRATKKFYFDNPFFPSQEHGLHLQYFINYFPDPYPIKPTTRCPGKAFLGLRDDDGQINPLLRFNSCATTRGVTETTTLNMRDNPNIVVFSSMPRSQLQ